MPAWSVRFDMRVPGIAPASAPEMYRAALELMTYADDHGCASISFMDHGSEDG